MGRRWGHCLSVYSLSAATSAASGWTFADDLPAICLCKTGWVMTNLTHQMVSALECIVVTPCETLFQNFSLRELVYRIVIMTQVKQNKERFISRQCKERKSVSDDTQRLVEGVWRRQRWKTEGWGLSHVVSTLQLNKMIRKKPDCLSAFLPLLSPGRDADHQLTLLATGCNDGWIPAVSNSVVSYCHILADTRPSYQIHAANCTVTAGAHLLLPWLPTPVPTQLTSRREASSSTRTLQVRDKP